MGMAPIFNDFHRGAAVSSNYRASTYTSWAGAQPCTPA